MHKQDLKNFLQKHLKKHSDETETYIIFSAKNISEQRKKKKELNQNINRNGQSNPCNFKSNNFCCTIVQSSNTFKSTVTNKVFNVYDTFNCKYSYTY